MRGTKAGKENTGNNNNIHGNYEYLQKDKQRYSLKQNPAATKRLKTVCVGLGVGSLNRVKSS